MQIGMYNCLRISAAQHLSILACIFAINDIVNWLQPFRTWLDLVIEQCVCEFTPFQVARQPKKLIQITQTENEKKKPFS